MERHGHSRWLTLALVIGYFVSVVAVTAALYGSTVTVAIGTLFLLPSVVFGALIARWWAAALPVMLGLVAYAISLATCGEDCLDEVLSDLRLLLIFVGPSVIAMAVGVILGKLIRRWHQAA